MITLQTLVRSVHIASVREVFSEQGTRYGPWSVASTLTAVATTPFDVYATGRAALGYGVSGLSVKAIAGLHVAMGTYSSIRGLVTRIKPDAVNEMLKKSNGGVDIDPTDCKRMARHMTGRSRISAAIGLGNCVASGMAIAMGSMVAGITALVLKAGGIGYDLYAGLQTAREAADILQHQVPAGTTLNATATCAAVYSGCVLNHLLLESVFKDAR